MKRTGIIVLDGPDASGKSTLAHAIAHMYDGEIMHQTWNKELGPRMFDYHTEALMEAISMSHDKLVIMDRLWISEDIYANTFRGGSPWPLMGRMLDRVLMKHAAMNIVCIPSTIKLGLEMHKKNLDPSHPYDDEKFKELLSRYIRLYWGCPKYKEDSYASWYSRMGGILRIRNSDYSRYSIDTEGRHMDMYIMLMIEMLTMRQKTQYQPALDGREHNILGHLHDAKVLFVGEKVNNKGELYNWPFYEYGNSSLYITKALQMINWREPLGMWVNAYNADGTISNHLKQLAAKLNVISLGDQAHHVVTSLGLKAKKVRHPQHAARFDGGDVSIYANELREVLYGS